MTLHLLTEKRKQLQKVKKWVFPKSRLIIFHAFKLKPSIEWRGSNFLGFVVIYIRLDIFGRRNVYSILQELMKHELGNVVDFRMLYSASGNLIPIKTLIKKN